MKGSSTRDFIILKKKTEVGSNAIVNVLQNFSKIMKEIKRWRWKHKRVKARYYNRWLIALCLFFLKSHKKSFDILKVEILFYTLINIIIIFHFMLKNPILKVELKGESMNRWTIWIITLVIFLDYINIKFKTMFKINIVNF